MTGEIYNSIRVIDFYKLLLVTEGQDQKKKKKKRKPDNVASQLEIIDICRPPYSTAAEYTHLSNTYKISSKIGHILGHKTSFSKFKNILIL